MSLKTAHNGPSFKEEEDALVQVKHGRPTIAEKGKGDAPGLSDEDKQHAINDKAIMELLHSDRFRPQYENILSCLQKDGRELPTTVPIELLRAVELREDGIAAKARTLQHMVKATTAKFNNCKARCDKLEADLEAKTQALQGVTERHMKLGKAHEQALAQLAKLTDECFVAKANIDTLQGELGTMRRRKEQMEETVKEKIDEANQLTEANVRLENELVERSGIIAKMRLDTAENVATIRQLQRERTEAEQSRAHAAESLQYMQQYEKAANTLIAEKIANLEMKARRRNAALLLYSAAKEQLGMLPHDADAFRVEQAAREKRASAPASRRDPSASGSALARAVASVYPAEDPRAQFMLSAFGLADNLSLSVESRLAAIPEFLSQTLCAQSFPAICQELLLKELNAVRCTVNSEAASFCSGAVANATAAFKAAEKKAQNAARVELEAADAKKAAAAESAPPPPAPAELRCVACGPCGEDEIKGRRAVAEKGTSTAKRTVRTAAVSAVAACRSVGVQGSPAEAANSLLLQQQQQQLSAEDVEAIADDLSRTVKETLAQAGIRPQGLPLGLRMDSRKTGLHLLLACMAGVKMLGNRVVRFVRDGKMPVDSGIALDRQAAFAGDASHPAYDAAFEQPQPPPPPPGEAANPLDPRYHQQPPARRADGRRRGGKAAGRGGAVVVEGRRAVAAAAKGPSARADARPRSDGLDSFRGADVQQRSGVMDSFRGADVQQRSGVMDSFRGADVQQRSGVMDSFRGADVQQRSGAMDSFRGADVQQRSGVMDSLRGADVQQRPGGLDSFHGTDFQQRSGVTDSFGGADVQQRSGGLDSYRAADSHHRPGGSLLLEPQQPRSQKTPSRGAEPSKRSLLSASRVPLLPPIDLSARGKPRNHRD
ncbi:hypothetical protein DIPPA_06790 [Diplonema papillatum]|nr:hypothetical protein DIPPA_06790 [Diplonema papillatum]